MIVFRLTKKKYSSELNGKGAAKFTNRWNSKGTEIVYTSDSRALAMAEVAVHLSLGTLPRDYVMIEISIPDSIKIKEIKPEELPTNWFINPPISKTQKIGDDFIDDMGDCILKVPSAVVQGDFNLLLNPYHKSFKKVKISKVVEFYFDDRIFKH